MKKSIKIIMCCCFAISIICLCWILGLRIGVDHKNTDFAVFMEYTDIETVGGEDVSAALKSLKECGLGAVVLRAENGEYDTAALEKVRAAKLGIVLLPDEDATIEEFLLKLKQTEGALPLLIADTMPSGDVNKPISAGVTVCLTENYDRTGSEEIENFDKENFEGDMAKLFYVIDEYARRYGTLGYDGADEIENIIFRAVTDRGIRAVWLTKFIDADGSHVSDIEEYGQLLANLKDRCGARGLSMGENVSVVEDVSVSPFLRTGIYIGVLIIGYFFVCSLTRKKLFRFGLTAICALVLLGGEFVMPLLTRKIAALGASVLFPCVAISYMFMGMKKLHDTNGSMDGMSIAAKTIGTFVVCGCISVIGGLAVNAILFDKSSMLEFYSFSGVKVSQFMPLLYGIYAMGKYLYGVNVDRIIDKLNELEKGSIRRKLKEKRTLVLAVVGGCLVIGVAVFILRTGDGILSVSVTEQRIRNWFEHVFYVRPRTKEFLIAIPALFAGFILCGRRLRKWAWPFGLLACIEFCSVVNTFCHIRCSLANSLIRTLIGMGLGAVLGFVLMFVVGQVILKIRRRKPQKEEWDF